jgi:hypothetical protein
MAPPRTPSPARRTCRRTLFVLATALAVALAPGVAALGDVVSNTLDPSVDATAENLALTAGASASNVTFNLTPANGDGKNGCNISGAGSTITFSVSSSLPSVATVTSPITFASCGDTPTVSVTPLTAGSTTVTIAEQSRTNVTGTFNLAPATFTVTVSAACPPAPSTAPAVTETNAPAATGWYNAASAAASFTVSPSTNAEYSLDGGTSWTAYSGPVTLGSDGTYDVTARSFRPASTGCPRIDGPAAAVTTLRVDRTSPSLSLSLPGANAAGWNDTPVTADWTCTDAAGGSGIDAATCPVDTTYGNGTRLAAVDVTVKDVAGNSSAPVDRREINVDTVAPTLTVDVPAPNGAGWNDSSVLADWSCDDDAGGSGIDPSTPCPIDSLYGEADSPVAAETVTVADLAGNTATATRRALLVDETAPGAEVVVAPDATNGWNNTDVTADYTCSDGSGSGLATPCPDDETFSAEGEYPAVDFSVVDVAGHESPTRTRRAVRIDTTAPDITVSLLDGDGAPLAPNVNGWFRESVTVRFTCVDPISGGVASGVPDGGCPTDQVLGEGIHDAAQFDVADVAGNHRTGSVPEVRIDLTVPTLLVDVTPETANAAGWNNVDVGVHFVCSDGTGSGIDALTCPADEAYGDGESAPEAGYTVTDLAGNVSATVTRRAVKVDTTAPTLALDLPPGNGAGWNNEPVTADWTCTDTVGGSGVDASTCPSDETYDDGANVVQASYVLKDVAGNSSPSVLRRAVMVDTQAPALSVDVTPAANGTGWNNSAVTVTWTCADNAGGSGIDVTTPCPLDAIYGEADSPIAALPVAVSDLAGNSASATRREIRIDETVPSAGVVVAPTDTNGWNNTTVTADYECADAGGSGLDPATPCPDDETLTDEGEYPSVEFHVDDHAGNSSPTSTRRTVRIDLTAPGVTVSLRDGVGVPIAPNAAGWFNQAVTVDFECSDPVSGGVASGVPASACPSDYELGEGEHAASGYDVSDLAGNHTTGAVPAVHIDVTAPSVAVTGVAQSFYLVGATPTPGCTTTDELSGVDVSAVASVSGPPGGVGLFTATCAGAVDGAGNPADTVSQSFVVGYGFVGFFQPINDPALSTPSSFKRGSTVPVKFALVDAAGQRIPDAAAQALVDACRVTLSWGAAALSGGAVTEPESSNPANSGNCFRYDPSADQFVFNLGTKAFTVGGWRLTGRVETGGAIVAVHDVVVVLR